MKSQLYEVEIISLILQMMKLSLEKLVAQYAKAKI